MFSMNDVSSNYLRLILQAMLAITVGCGGNHQCRTFVAQYATQTQSTPSAIIAARTMETASSSSYTVVCTFDRSLTASNCTQTAPGATLPDGTQGPDRITTVATVWATFADFLGG